MSEDRFCYKYPHPAVTTDCVVFGWDGARLNLLLIKRGHEPYENCWAFPGGFLNIDEDAPDGCRRELREETGIEVANDAIVQLGAYTKPDRDPRERVISIAFFTVINVADVQGGDDATQAQWFTVDSIPPLAFDHQQILNDAVGRIQALLHFGSQKFVAAQDLSVEQLMVSLPKPKK